MKHEDVVAALKIIVDKGMAINISKDDLQDLRSYNLIEIAKGEENERSPACVLTNSLILSKNSSISALSDSEIDD